MSNSIKQLQNLLEAKGGSTLSSNSFQNLKSLLNALGSARAVNTVPAENGGNLSGIKCTGHDVTKFPYSGGLSLSQILNHSTSYLKACTCNAETQTVGFCVARTSTPACSCNAVGDPCTCKSRDACCESRTLGGNPNPCDNRTVCSGNTSSVTCGSRTGVAACSCNTRCSCNVLSQFS